MTISGLRKSEGAIKRGRSLNSQAVQKPGTLILKKESVHRQNS